MFLLTALVYPGVLAVLCLGAGLLVDRASGSFLPAALLPAVGLAALIAISQLCTYVSPLAPATPYAIVLAALAGAALARARLAGLARRARHWAALAVLPVIAYALALAPVLLAGRPSLSSYLALADSAVHIVGADYLVRHGQAFANLDLRNSYGLTINAYYNSSYPSGADTLLGAGARLLSLPVIWVFQPFNAFVLAVAGGPAWLLARRAALRGALAVLAALAATTSALVYGYELVGSIKELVALCMILSLGAITVMHRRWLDGAANRAIPLALVLAAGISSLGAGFGAWGLATLAVPATIALRSVRGGRLRGSRVLLLAGAAGLTTLIAALPTFVNLSGSLHVATRIASTSNPGNLHEPLHWQQVLGMWLHGSYKQQPTGVAGALTEALVLLTLASCVVGAYGLVRARLYALLAWLGAIVALLLLVSLYATTWVEAKGLVITSPVVVLGAWSGVAALRMRTSTRSSRGPARLGAGSFALALVLAAGALASDAAQYHSAPLAPTARYEELASLGRAFAHRGPALFVDFDEYALYELRDLDIGGPDFAFAPPSLAAVAPAGHGGRVELDRAPPRALRAYPLIITRRNPDESPPPAAYREVWQGLYYVVWARVAQAAPAFAHLAPALGAASFCSRLLALARRARVSGARLIAARGPQRVSIAVGRLPHPTRWGHQRGALVMSSPGTLVVPLTIPRAGAWELSLAGEFSPRLRVRVDGRALATISGQLGGNSLVPNLSAPMRIVLTAGAHVLSLTRGGLRLTPGDGGPAVLARVVLTPAGAPARTLVTLNASASAGARSLCARARSYRWVELVPSARA